MVIFSYFPFFAILSAMRSQFSLNLTDFLHPNYIKTCKIMSSFLEGGGDKIFDFHHQS